jgi:hypothetical protein
VDVLPTAVFFLPEQQEEEEEATLFLFYRHDSHDLRVVGVHQWTLAGEDPHDPISFASHFAHGHLVPHLLHYSWVIYHVLFLKIFLVALFHYSAICHRVHH